MFSDRCLDLLNLRYVRLSQLSDLAASPKTIPRVVETASLPVSGGTVPVLLHDQPCNGIGYVRILFELKDRVPAHLLPLLPLYARCLTQLGTQHTSEVRRDCVEAGVCISPLVSLQVNLSHRMGKYTGGIHAFNEVLDVRIFSRFFALNTHVTGFVVVCSTLPSHQTLCPN